LRVTSRGLGDVYKRQESTYADVSLVLEKYPLEMKPIR
jgi:hypothetical protein